MPPLHMPLSKILFEKHCSLCCLPIMINCKHDIYIDIYVDLFDASKSQLLAP